MASETEQPLSETPLMQLPTKPPIRELLFVVFAVMVPPVYRQSRKEAFSATPAKPAVKRWPVTFPVATQSVKAAEPQAQPANPPTELAWTFTVAAVEQDV